MGEKLYSLPVGFSLREGGVPLPAQILAGQRRPASRSEFVGLCPLHAETRPSFYVSARKNLFYCHGCGQGGDLIRVIELSRHLSFRQSLAYLDRNFKNEIVYRVARRVRASANGEGVLRLTHLRVCTRIVDAVAICVYPFAEKGLSQLKFVRHVIKRRRLLTVFALELCLSFALDHGFLEHRMAADQSYRLTASIGPHRDVQLDLADRQVSSL
jgi:hypothetical protein